VKTFGRLSWNWEWNLCLTGGICLSSGYYLGSEDHVNA